VAKNVFVVSSYKESMSFIQLINLPEFIMFAKG